ncbi:MAG: hypothetical protein C5B58_10070, partial [Acidobacteria bacterium]
MLPSCGDLDHGGRGCLCWEYSSAEYSTLNLSLVREKPASEIFPGWAAKPQTSQIGGAASECRGDNRQDK